MDFYKGVIPIFNTDTNKDSDNLHPPGASFGLIPRDYSVYPAEMFDIPSQMQIIPESDWDAIYDEQEAQQSSLEHLYLRGPNGGGVFENLDQNGNGYSHTEDTEVLTEKGWVRWPDWNRTDLLATVNMNTHAMEFQQAIEHHAYEYNDEMFYSTNRRLDFGVTRNHRMIVRKWDERLRTLSPYYTEQRADSLGWYVGMMAAPKGHLGTDIVELSPEGCERRYDGDDFIALLALICSDGYAGGSESTRNLVSFCCFNQKRYPMVAALAARLGFKEQPSRRGVWSLRDISLANWIRANCYLSGNPVRSGFKKIPEIVKWVSQRQIKHFLSFFGDKNHGVDSQEVYYSSSKRMIDDLQEILLRVGKRGSISSREPRSVVYSVTNQEICSGVTYQLDVSKTNRLCIDRKKHIETDHYKGLVYCATVPNGTLITRRNGSVLISGNCWAYSTGHAMMLARMLQNQPLIRLNPHSVAAIIKNGADEGGWCGLSAEFVRENGIAPEGTGAGLWPLHSRNTRLDTPELRAIMAKYKSTEEWVDLNRSVYDVNMSKQQYATALMCRQPSPSDYNFWSHSVCAVRWVRISKGNWGTLILNSWKGWGRYGLGVLEGSKAVPNSMLSIRVARAF